MESEVCGMHESGEDYLETILILKNKKQVVRSVDVAQELGFSRPSVSRAVNLLKDNGYLLIAENGELSFTKAGLAKAQSVYDKHTSLMHFLIMTTGVDEATAENDACRIEHIISEATFEGIKRYIKENECFQKNLHNE